MSNEFDRKRSGRSAQLDADDVVGPTPGKYTNTGIDANGGIGPMPDVPGRRSSTEGLDPARVHAAARQGVRGASQRLPFHDLIQEAFGHHDISDVTATVGGDAAEASHDIGATAYAYGNRLAFATAPDLHTVAHEAAHVVQQRGGVSLAGGVGRADDSYEQHADAVAAQVVAGRSAEALLDRMASPGKAATPAVQRLHEDPERASSGSYEKQFLFGVPASLWVGMHGAQLALQTGVHLYMQPFALKHPAVRWTAGDSKAFTAALWTPFAANPSGLWALMSATCAPDRLIDVVDAGRDCSPNPMGPMEWRPGVVDELHRVYARRIIESLARIVPRWAHVKNQLELRAQAGDVSANHAPTAEQVTTSHPIDPYVVDALGGSAVLDTALYREMNRSERISQPIGPAATIKLDDVQFSEKEGGVEGYVRVLHPSNVTREQVAKALTGSETNAWQIEDLSPLFRVPVFLYTAVARHAWIASGGNAVVSFGTMTDAYRDELALRSARGVEGTKGVTATPDGKKLILDRIGLTLSHLDSMRAELEPGDFSAQLLASFHTQLLARGEKLRTGDAGSAVAWDSQTKGQYDIVEKSLRGVQMARTLGKPSKDWPKAHAVVERTVSNFVQAVLASDTVSVGNEKLDFADAQVHQLRLSLLDLLLADSRTTLEEARKVKGTNKDGPYLAKAEDVQFEKTEARLRTKLVAIRDVALQDPERARVMTEQLAAHIGELATGVAIVGDFDQMDAAWQALYGSINGVGAWSGTNIDMVEGANAVTELAATWRTIYATWKKDRKAGAAMLEKERPKLQAMMTRVRSTLKDSAAINKWVGFGLLVGIALVTGGIGAFVEGVAGVGTLAGFAAATVVEATVFTSLSRSLFSTDPSVGGYLGELGGNVLMFGALKTISMVYVGLVGEVAAGTLKGKAGLLLTQFVSLNGYALYDADKKKRHDTGKGLDGDEVGEISLHNFLFLTATALGSKLVEPGIESLKLKGSYINDLARLRRVKIEMIAVTRDIEAGARSVDRARELVGKQRELIDAEAEAIRKIDKLVAAGKAAAAGLDLAEYARLKSEHATAAAELERSEMALYLEPAGPNTMLCRSEHFDKAQDYYARQPNTKVHPETGTHPLTGARSFEVEPPAEVTAGKAEPATRFRVIERMAGGRAKVTERPEISGQANDLARIRTGTPGRIRPASELSNADVAHSLNDQLQKIRPGEIDDMLGHFPAEQQAHAREVLARSSGFGKMESLNPLRAALQPHLDAGMKLYTPGRGSLADNVTYLASKGTFKANPGPIHTTSQIKPGTVVILDPVVLAEIKADPVFAKSLGDNRAVLVQPRGFNDGINMFNASSPDAIAQRTAHLLGRAETIQAGSKGKLSFDDAISAALDEGTQDALKANPALTGLLEIVDPASHPDLSSGALAQQLNGDAGITEAQIEAVLSSLSEPDRALIRELFAQQAEVFSPRRISNDLVTQHQRNLQTAAQHGINPEKIFYFIPDSQKLGPQGVPIGESYGMVSMAHREATGTPVEHYINGTAGLKGLGPDTMLVILDDVAGTGMSLDAASAQAAKSGYKGEIVVSPLVSTQEANGLFMGNGRPGSGLVNQRPNTSYAPARIMQALESSGFFKSLPTSQQRNLLVLLGDPGFGDNALSMTFPYMAPDNNNALFGDQIAKEFIVNKNRKASKGKSWTTSPTVIK